MKISEQELSRLLAISHTGRTRTRLGTSTVLEAPGVSLNNDAPSHVEFSPTTQEIQRVKRIVQALPDVRQARVDELKAQIESGTYHVSSEDIADLMIRRVLADNTSL